MAGATITEIVSHVKSAGYANPSKYRVDIHKYSQIFNFRDISLNCEIASLPGFNVTTFDKKMYGTSIKMPYGESSGEISLSFYCSEDHRERKFFERWIHQIRDPKTLDIAFQNDYLASMHVTNYDNSGGTSLLMSLIDCYPIAISPIDLGYGATSSTERLMISFVYSRYLPFEESATLGSITQQPSP